MSAPNLSLYHDTRRTKLATNKCPVKLRIYFNGRTKHLPTGIDLTPEEFEKSYLAERPRSEFKAIKQTLQLILSRAIDIAGDLKLFTIERFEKRLLKPTGANVDVFAYYSEVMEDLLREERLGTHSNYDLSAKSLRAFLTS